MSTEDFAKDCQREAPEQPGMILEVIALEGKNITTPKAA